MEVHLSSLSRSRKHIKPRSKFTDTRDKIEHYLDLLFQLQQFIEDETIASQDISFKWTQFLGVHASSDLVTDEINRMMILNAIVRQFQAQVILSSAQIVARSDEKYALLLLAEASGRLEYVQDQGHFLSSIATVYNRIICAQQVEYVLHTQIEGMAGTKLKDCTLLARSAHSLCTDALHHINTLKEGRNSRGLRSILCFMELIYESLYSLVEGKMYRRAGNRDWAAFLFQRVTQIDYTTRAKSILDLGTYFTYTYHLLVERFLFIRKRCDENYRAVSDQVISPISDSLQAELYNVVPIRVPERIVSVTQKYLVPMERVKREDFHKTLDIPKHQQRRGHVGKAPPLHGLKSLYPDHRWKYGIETNYRPSAAPELEKEPEQPRLTKICHRDPDIPIRDSRIGCALCHIHFTKENLPGTVVRSKIIELKSKWGIKCTLRRFNMPSFLYTTTQVCALCFEIVSGTYRDEQTDTDGIGKMIRDSIVHDFHQRQEMHSTQLVNIALNKPTRQSSTQSEQYAQGAVDGSPVSSDTTFTQTLIESDPWWQVDLERHQQISSIEVWGVPSVIREVKERNFPFWIIVSAYPFGSCSFAKAQDTGTASREFTEVSHQTIWTLPQPVMGRFVRIQLQKEGTLTLSQVCVLSPQKINKQYQNAKGFQAAMNAVLNPSVGIRPSSSSRLRPKSAATGSRCKRRTMKPKVEVPASKPVGRLRPKSAGIHSHTLSSEARRQRGKARREGALEANSRKYGILTGLKQVEGTREEAWTYLRGSESVSTLRREMPESTEVLRRRAFR